MNIFICALVILYNTLGWIILVHLLQRVIYKFNKKQITETIGRLFLVIASIIVILDSWGLIISSLICADDVTNNPIKDDVDYENYKFGWQFDYISLEIFNCLLWIICGFSLTIYPSKFDSKSRKSQSSTSLLKGSSFLDSESYASYLLPKNPHDVQSKFQIFSIKTPQVTYSPFSSNANDHEKTALNPNNHNNRCCVLSFWYPRLLIIFGFLLLALYIIYIFRIGLPSFVLQMFEFFPTNPRQQPSAMDSVYFLFPDFNTNPFINYFNYVLIALHANIFIASLIFHKRYYNTFFLKFCLLYIISYWSLRILANYFGIVYFIYFKQVYLNIIVITFYYVDCFNDEYPTTVYQKLPKVQNSIEIAYHIYKSRNYSNFLDNDFGKNPHFLYFGAARRIENPEKIALLILPGMANVKEDYRHLCYKLCQHSRDVYVLDYRGMGESQNAPFDSKLELSDIYANDVMHFINETFKERPVFLLGFNIGANVALKCALLNELSSKHERNENKLSRLSGLVLCSVHIGHDLYIGSCYQTYKEFDVNRNNHVFYSKSGRYYNCYQKFKDFFHFFGYNRNSKSICQQCKFIATDARFKIESQDLKNHIAIPSLIMCGAEDSIFDYKMYRSIFESMQSIASFEEIPDAGHNFWFENSTAFIQSLNNWLDFEESQLNQDLFL